MGCPYLGQQVDRCLATSFSSKFYSTDFFFFLETGHWGWALLSQVPGVCVRHRNSSSQGQVLRGGFFI